MMISGSSLVLFLFLVPTSTQFITKECGENLEIPTSMDTVALTIPATKELLLSINNSTRESQCTENEKFCVQVGEDGTQMTLTVHSVTFEDQGKYALRYEPSVRDPKIFYIIVTGVCEPKLSPSTDDLTCEVDVENTYNSLNSTIVWMDKHRKIYKNNKTFPKRVTEKVTKLQDTLTLTDETREVEICCTVSYVKEDKKEERQSCQNQPSKVKGTDNNKNIIFIPILCVLGIAISVSLYILRRRRMSFTQKNRERTLSETGLMEDHQAENTEGALSEPLQRPQDQV